MTYLKNSRLIKGSLQEQRLRCGNPGCHCHRRGGAGHGPYVYLAAVWGRQTHSFLLKKGDVPVVRRYIEGHAKLQKEVEQVTQRNVRQLRRGELR